MSREEDQRTFEEILSAYRKGDESRHAEDFGEAMDALESDSALEQWFEDDQAFDAEFRAALNDVEVPEQKAVEEPKAEITRFPFIKFAAAALIMIALGLFGLSTYDSLQNTNAEARVVEFRSHAAAFAASSDFGLDLMDNDLSKLRDLNTSNGGVYGPAMDKVFASGLPMGCKVLDWNGTKISLYCFGNDQNQVVHCFIVPLDQLNGERAAQHIRAIIERSDRDTGGFVAGENAYLLVSSMPGVDIKPFLLPAQKQFAAIIPIYGTTTLAFQTRN